MRKNPLAILVKVTVVPGVLLDPPEPSQLAPLDLALELDVDGVVHDDVEVEVGMLGVTDGSLLADLDLEKARLLRVVFAFPVVFAVFSSRWVKGGCKSGNGDET